MLLRLGLTIFLGLGLAAHVELSPAQDLTSGQMEADLLALAVELPRRHVDAFAVQDAQAFQQRVQQLRDRLEGLTPTEFEWEVQRLLAGLRDAHTQLLPPSVGKQYLPVNFKSLAAGIYIRAIDQEHRNLLQARLVSLGGIPASEVLERISPWVSHDNDWGLRVTVDQRLNQVDLLQIIGGQPVEGKWELVCEKDGVLHRIQLTGVPVEGAGSIPFAIAPDCLAYARSKSFDHWNDWLADDQTLYFHYRRCRDGAGLNRLIEGTRGFVAQREVQAFVIDLRENSGGDSRLLAPLIDYLSSHPRFSRPGSLYVLVGRQTFSSAVLNALELKTRSQAILVGEPPQGRPNHFGEVQRWTLPASRWTVLYSTRSFRPLADSDPEELELDIRVPLTEANWFAPLDPCLEAVRQDRARRKNEGAEAPGGGIR